MGKFMFAILLVFAVELALFVFGGIGYAQTSLFSLIYNPSSVWTNPLMLLFFIAIGVSIGATIIPLNLWNVNTIGIYAGIIVITMRFIYSIFHLGTFIYGSLSGLGELAPLITAIIIGPLAIGYAIASLEWMRANQ